MIKMNCIIFWGLYVFRKIIKMVETLALQIDIADKAKSKRQDLETGYIARIFLEIF